MPAYTLQLLKRAGIFCLDSELTPHSINHASKNRVPYKYREHVYTVTGYKYLKESAKAELQGIL